MAEPDPSDARPHGSARWLGWPTVAALAALHIALALSSARLESATFDEGLHLTSGYANWLGGDQRLHSGNGVLAQRWFALPLVLSGDRFSFPAPDRVIANQRVDDFHLLTHFLAHVFFYEVGNDPRSLLLRARTMGALLGALLCVLVYAWSRRLWGPGAAIVSTALCAFSPNVLAHARLATSDLMFATLLLAAIGLVWRSFWRPSLLAVIASGAALGALAVTKLSAAGAIPMVALLVIARALFPTPLVFPGGRSFHRPGPRALALLASLLVQGLAAASVIWAIYGFRYDVVPEGTLGQEGMERQWEWVHERDGFAIDAIDALRRVHALPEGFLYGAAFVVRHSEERNSFFRGMTRIGGDWRFFPYAIGVKTPLALFALLGLAGAAVLRVSPEARSTIARTAAPLLALIGVHGALAVSSEINLGLRHVLPLYPPMFILAGGALTLSARRGLARTVALVLTVLGTAAFAGASLAIWPHYLAYFNPLVGPSHGYRVLVDSSLDWGQDLDNLASDLKGRPEALETPIYLAYFGSADPKFHDFGQPGQLDVRLLPGFFDWSTIQHREATAPLDWTLEPGLYAISATILQQPWARIPREWGPDEHRRYARLAERFRPLERMPHPATALRSALADPQLREDWMYFRELRLSRLCQVLREREPDWQVGYSIGVYRVGPEELARVAPSSSGEETPR